MHLGILKLMPRHKWFSATSRDAESWDGPHKTFEAAARATYCDTGHESPEPVFVTQGFKLTKRDREDQGAEYDWEVDSRAAVEVRLPAPRKTLNARSTPTAPAFPPTFHHVPNFHLYAPALSLGRGASPARELDRSSPRDGFSGGGAGAPVVI